MFVSQTHQLTVSKRSYTQAMLRGKTASDSNVWQSRRGRLTEGKVLFILLLRVYFAFVIGCIKIDQSALNKYIFPTLLTERKTLQLLDEISAAYVMVDTSTYPRQKQFVSSFNHGQTSANRTEPGPSFQLQRQPCVCHALVRLLIKTAQLKVENSAQTTFRFTPVGFRAPRFNISTRLSITSMDIPKLTR